MSRVKPETKEPPRCMGCDDRPAEKGFYFCSTNCGRRWAEEYLGGAVAEPPTPLRPIAEREAYQALIQEVWECHYYIHHELCNLARGEHKRRTPERIADNLIGNLKNTDEAIVRFWKRHGRDG